MLRGPQRTLQSAVRRVALHYKREMYLSSRRSFRASSYDRQYHTRSRTCEGIKFQYAVCDSNYLVTRRDSSLMATKFSIMAPLMNTYKRYLTTREDSTTLERIEHDIFSCNTWEGVRAAELLREMKSKGMQPSAQIYNKVLQVCATSGLWESALEAFREMQADKGVEVDVESYRFAMSACAKNGQADRALDLWEEMKQQEGLKLNMIAYRSAISAYCRNNQLTEACNLLEVMRADGIDADATVYHTLALAYDRLNQKDRVLHSGTKILTDYQLDRSATAETITELVDSGKLNQALDAFRAYKGRRRMPTRKMYAALLRGYREAGLLAEAREILRDASKGTASSLAEALYTECMERDLKREEGSFEHCLLLLQDMKAAHIPMNQRLRSAVAAFLRKKEVREAAIRSLATTHNVDKEISAFVLRTIVHVTVPANQLDEGIEVYESLQRYGVPVHRRTSRYALIAYSNLGRPFDALPVIRGLQKIPEELDLKTYRTIRGLFLRMGEKEQAYASEQPINVLTVMLTHGFTLDTFAYNTSLLGCLGDWRRALERAGEMRSRHVTADRLTYEAIITSCIIEGKGDLARDTLHAMRQDGTNPDVRHYRAAIESCRLHGMHEIAIQLLTELDKEDPRFDLQCYVRAAHVCKVARKHGLRKSLIHSIKTGTKCNHLPHGKIEGRAHSDSHEPDMSSQDVKLS